MAERKPFALRLNVQTLKALERWADEEFRSVNGQIEFVLHQALQKAGRLPTETSSKKENEK